VELLDSSRFEPLNEIVPNENFSLVVLWVLTKSVLGVPGHMKIMTKTLLGVPTPFHASFHVGTLEPVLWSDFMPRSSARRGFH
jgi:hypothetical protein